MTAERRLPDWLSSAETRELPKERGRFLRKSAAVLRAILEKARRAPEQTRKHWGLSTPSKLALTALIVALVAASGNFVFVEIVGCILLVFLAFLDSRFLARVLTIPIQASFLALLILLPSLFWGQSRALIVVPCKTFVTTTALSLLAHTTNWNRFTCAFKTFGAPDSLVFLFDLTLKYIVVLSEICLETLDAVLLRSIGRDRAKARTLGGIVGGVFLRSQKASREQFDAMTCRCFSGVYRRYRIPWRLPDVLGAFVCIVAVALFIYLEFGV